jgi:hypothetical protein
VEKSDAVHLVGIPPSRHRVKSPADSSLVETAELPRAGLGPHRDA